MWQVQFGSALRHSILTLIKTHRMWWFNKARIVVVILGARIVPNTPWLLTRGKDVIQFDLISRTAAMCFFHVFPEAFSLQVATAQQLQRLNEAKLIQSLVPVSHQTNMKNRWWWEENGEYCRRIANKRTEGENRNPGRKGWVCKQIRAVNHKMPCFLHRQYEFQCLEELMLAFWGLGRTQNALGLSARQRLAVGIRSTSKKTKQCDCALVPFNLFPLFQHISTSITRYLRSTFRVRVPGTSQVLKDSAPWRCPNISRCDSASRPFGPFHRLIRLPQEAMKSISWELSLGCHAF